MIVHKIYIPPFPDDATSSQSKISFDPLLVSINIQSTARWNKSTPSRRTKRQIRCSNFSKHIWMGHALRGNPSLNFFITIFPSLNNSNVLITKRMASPDNLRFIFVSNCHITQTVCPDFYLGVSGNLIWQFRNWSKATSHVNICNRIFNKFVSNNACRTKSGYIFISNCLLDENVNKWL